jgi:hypothetical protein
MSIPDTQPCPYCGELIKVNAVKCRFCGEFLDEEPEAEARPKKKKKQSDERKWLIPVGRSVWALLAGYFGILALIPIPIIAWGMAEAADARSGTKEMILYACAVVNILLGLIALGTGVVGLVTLLKSEKSGIGRSAFGIAAGLAGAIGYILVVHLYWIPTYVKLR